MSYCSVGFTFYKFEHRSGEEEGVWRAPAVMVPPSGTVYLQHYIFSNRRCLFTTDETLWRSQNNILLPNCYLIYLRL